MEKIESRFLPPGDVLLGITPPRSNEPDPRTVAEIYMKATEAVFEGCREIAAKSDGVAHLSVRLTREEIVKAIKA